MENLIEHPKGVIGPVLTQLMMILMLMKGVFINYYVTVFQVVSKDSLRGYCYVSPIFA